MPIFPALLYDTVTPLIQDGVFSSDDENLVGQRLEAFPFQNNQEREDSIVSIAQAFVDQRIHVEKPIVSSNFYSSIFKAYEIVTTKNYPTLQSALESAEKGRDIQVYGFGEYHNKNSAPGGLGLVSSNGPLNTFSQSIVPYLVQEKGVRVIGTEYLPVDIPELDLCEYFIEGEPPAKSYLDKVMKKSIYTKYFLEGIRSQFYNKDMKENRDILYEYTRELKERVKNASPKIMPSVETHAETPMQLIHQATISVNSCKEESSKKKYEIQLPVEIKGLNRPKSFYKKRFLSERDKWDEGTQIIMANCADLVSDALLRGKKVALYTGTLHNEITPKKYEVLSYAVPLMQIFGNHFSKRYLEIDLLPNFSSAFFSNLVGLSESGPISKKLNGRDHLLIAQGSKTNYVLHSKEDENSFTLTLPVPQRVEKKIIFE